MSLEVPLSAVVLAGGASRRMGRDKAWVEHEGQSLLALAVNKVRALGCAEIFISGRPGENYAALNCPVLHDLTPGNGPLGGIERGLHACAAPVLLVLAVDLPRMTSKFLAELRGRCDSQTGVVPELNGQLEPLAAIYPKRCFGQVQEALEQLRLSARGFAETCRDLGLVNTFPVTAVDAECFGNWNSPADLQT